jgi:hypothetical protein
MHLSFCFFFIRILSSAAIRIIIGSTVSNGFHLGFFPILLKFKITYSDKHLICNAFTENVKFYSGIRLKILQVNIKVKGSKTLKS